MLAGIGGHLPIRNLNLALLLVVEPVDQLLHAPGPVREEGECQLYRPSTTPPPTASRQRDSDEPDPTKLQEVPTAHPAPGERTAQPATFFRALRHLRSFSLLISFPQHRVFRNRVGLLTWLLEDRLFGIGVEEADLGGVQRQAHLLAQPRGALDRDPRHHQLPGVVGRSRTLGTYHLLDAVEVDGLSFWHPEVHVLLAAHALYDLRLDLDRVRGVGTRCVLGKPRVLDMLRAYP